MKAEVFNITGNGLKPIDTEKKLPAGSILLFKGYGKDGKEYATLNEFSGGQQKLVSLHPDEPGFSFTWIDNVSDWQERNGVGYYYPPEDYPNPEAGKDQLLDAINAAKQSERNQKENREHQREERERLEAIGKQMFDKMKPKNAKAVIIAELREDKSDLMTDYFSSTTKRLVVLAWSKSSRNNFSEMRKTAAKFPETKELAVKNKEYKHRENYSMGHGYYLKKKWVHNDGWMISKSSFQFSINDVYRALAKGDHVLKEEEQQARQKSTGGELRIESYSPKAIVIRGNTKERREDLKALGAKFNPRLKGGPGWIFPKRLQAVAEDALNL